jgi:hypothetical protein
MRRISEPGTTLQVLVTTNVPISPIVVILMMSEIRSYETSILSRVTQRKIPGNGIFHSHRREHHK